MKFFTIFPTIKDQAFKRPFTAFVIVATLLLAFFFIRQALTPKTTETTQDTSSQTRETRIFEIGKDTPTATVIGTIDRENTVTVIAQGSGVVGSVWAQENNFIKKGSVIASITPSPAETARLLAESEESNALKNKATEKEILSLSEKISRGETESEKKEDLAEAIKKLGKNNLDQKILALKLNSEIARANESLTKPFSPIAGRVEAVYVAPGDFVTPGTKIATLSSKNPRTIVRANIPLAFGLLLDPLKQHELRISEKESLPMTLEHISTQPLSEDGFYATFSLVGEKTLLLGDGSSFEILVSTKGFSDKKVLIPLSALRTTRETSSILLMKDGIAKEKSIQTGSIIGNFIEVIGDIKEGDRIILDRTISHNNLVVEKQ